jgi:hypothetical protein
MQVLGCGKSRLTPNDCCLGAGAFVRGFVRGFVSLAQICQSYTQELINYSSLLPALQYIYPPCLSY